MTKREAEKILKKYGFRQDNREDHREWWKPGSPLLDIYLDGPKNRNNSFSIHFVPRKREINADQFEAIIQEMIGVMFDFEVCDDCGYNHIDQLCKNGNHIGKDACPGWDGFCCECGKEVMIQKANSRG